jgi:hypothetical protein
MRCNLMRRVDAANLPIMWKLLTFTVVIGCSSTETTSDGGTIYTSDPPANIPCNVDSDCCVVADECHSAAYVVHAGDTVEVPQTGCNLCLVPAVQVWCAGGTCQSGRVSTGFDPSFSQNHCGSLPLPDGAALTGPDGGAESMTVYTCQ